MIVSLPNQKPIALRFPTFPVPHQTFVLCEVLALRQRGVPLVLYSIKRPSTHTKQPETTALAAEVCYLPTALAAVLEELLGDEVQRQRLALGGYQKAVTEFDRATSIEALVGLFRGGEISPLSHPGGETAQGSRTSKTDRGCP